MKLPQLFCCLHVREFPAQALLRLRPDARLSPCAVMEGEPPLERVCSSNAAARKLGVEATMTRVEIDTVPGVSVLARSLLEEESACEALLECAGRFSPRVQPITNPTSFVCVVDITGTEALFGQPARLARNLLEEVRKLGLAASAAVSANFHAAAALAQSMPVVNHALVVPLGRESHALAALPVAMISLTAEQAETLTQWGITTLGQLAQLPEAALISRMGQQGKRLRLLARGEHPHHFEPIEPAFTLRERLEFESPIDILDSLLFVVSTMLEQLALRAGARALALASITVKLSLEGNATHVRTVRPALPSNDRQLWIKLIHLDLEAHPPDAAILALELHAAPGAAGKVQMGLFSPQTPEAARLDVTLARIRAIVGDHAVGSAVLEDTHRPDTFRLQAFTVPSGRPSPAVSLPGKSVSTRAVLRQLRPAGKHYRQPAGWAAGDFLFSRPALPGRSRIWTVVDERCVVEWAALAAGAVGPCRPLSRDLVVLRRGAPFTQQSVDHGGAL